MIPYLILVISLLLIFGGYKLTCTEKLKSFKNLKSLAIYTFIAYCATLFYHYAIDSYHIKVDSALGSGIGFGVNFAIFIVILRTLTTVSVVASVISPFYKNKYFKIICAFIVPLIAILNVIFLNSNLVAMYGRNYKYFSDHRSYGYIFTVGGLIASSVCNLYCFIKNGDYKMNVDSWFKSIGKVLIIILVMSIALMQQGIFYNFFGVKPNVLTKDFSIEHLICIFVTILATILPYVFMRNKSLEDRKLFFGVAVMAGFLQYFYLYRGGLSGLPLHLCNTAVVMMLLAYVFDLKGVFYFSFFVNVLGAIFAILMPICDQGASHIKTIHFWYNHINAFALPILGIALGVYERPTLKMMLRAIAFFSLYFFATIILNAWFNSPALARLAKGAEIDYFFTYSDFFIDKVEAFRPLKYNWIWKVNIGGNPWTFFPVYQFSIYGVFIILMFVIWVVYDYLFQVSDRHYELLMLKRIHRQDLMNLRQLQKDGKISDPINKEAIKMVKIENFTKQYAGAQKPSVENFSLEIHDGEVFGFIGHNGSGKSTTIKSLVGIQSLTSGKMLIDGYDITKQPLEAKLRIGYVSDNHAVYEKLTGREYINYVADLYLVDKKVRDERINKYVTMFNLTDAIDREIKGYSHGMKQKIVVIASLIHNPKVWVLDEPLTGLDPTSAYQIKECMREHANNGNIVFFSSHVIEVVEKICDRICIIQRGKLVGVYNLKDLGKDGLTLEELYLKHVAQANYNTEAPTSSKDASLNK